MALVHLVTFWIRPPSPRFILRFKLPAWENSAELGKYCNYKYMSWMIALGCPCLTTAPLLAYGRITLTGDSHCRCRLWSALSQQSAPTSPVRPLFP